MRRHRTNKVPKKLVPVITGFAIIFSLAVFLAQKIESPAMVILAPKLVIETDVPLVSATSYLVFDMTTGDRLVEREASKQVPIASVTKLFAAATLVANFELQSTTTVQWSDIEGGGEAGKLVYGRTYSYQELLFPLLLESSNDAGATLVRSTEGLLVAEMNAYAKELGVTSTTFVDGSGLADGNVSSALDLKILLTDAYTRRPHVFDITRLPQYIGPYAGWRNNSPVVSFSGYLGGKHGYTTAAGRTLVAVFDEQILDHSYRLGYILLNSTNLADDVTTLRTFINNSASSHSGAIMQ
jgi:D-alanyl-D-alanine carboxypeptidase